MVLAALLSGPQIVPTAELNRLGPRKGGLSIEEVTEFRYHPAYLLRNPGDKRLVWEDIQQVMRVLGIAPARR